MIGKHFYSRDTNEETFNLNIKSLDYLNLSERDEISTWSTEVKGSSLMYYLAAKYIFRRKDYEFCCSKYGLDADHRYEYDIYNKETFRLKLDAKFNLTIPDLKMLLNKKSGLEMYLWYNNLIWDLLRIIEKAKDKIEAFKRVLKCIKYAHYCKYLPSENVGSYFVSFVWLFMELHNSGILRSDSFSVEDIFKVFWVRREIMINSISSLSCDILKFLIEKAPKELCHYLKVWKSDDYLNQISHICLTYAKLENAKFIFTIGAVNLYNSYAFVMQCFFIKFLGDGPISIEQKDSPLSESRRFRISQVLQLFSQFKNKDPNAIKVLLLLSSSNADPLLAKEEFMTISCPESEIFCEEMWQWYSSNIGEIEQKPKPRSLKHLARVAVRQSLASCCPHPGFNVFQFPKLQLPRTLIDYLDPLNCEIH